MNGPNRDATPNFPPANCRPTTSPILPGPPKGGWSTNFELSIWWRHAEEVCLHGPLSSLRCQPAHPDFGACASYCTRNVSDRQFLSDGQAFLLPIHTVFKRLSEGQVGGRYPGRSDQRFSGDLCLDGAGNGNRGDSRRPPKMYTKPWNGKAKSRRDYRIQICWTCVASCQAALTR